MTKAVTLRQQGKGERRWCFADMPADTLCEFLKAWSERVEATLKKKGLWPR
jgi:hypothetical protein